MKNKSFEVHRVSTVDGCDLRRHVGGNRAANEGRCCRVGGRIARGVYGSERQTLAQTDGWGHSVTDPESFLRASADAGF